MRKHLFLLLFILIKCRGDLDMGNQFSSFALDTNRWTPGAWGTTINYLILDPLNTFNKMIGQTPRTIIRTALDQIEKVVNCLKFNEVDDDTANVLTGELIIFESVKSGCNSPLGKQTGRPTRINLELSTDCLNVITVKHELMHSLGFPHEHQRPDRDLHVAIKTDAPNDRVLRDNINIWNGNKQYHLYTPYDYTSIMHYISELRGNTKITAHNQHYQGILSSMNDLSIGDIMSLNVHFKCKMIPLEYFSQYMVYFEHAIYQELKQLDVKECEVPEIKQCPSLRSYLLYPFRVNLETYDNAKEMYPFVGGQYQRVAEDEYRSIDAA